MGGVTMELNDLGALFLSQELSKILGSCTFKPSEFIDRANKNIAKDNLYLDLEAKETWPCRRHRIEFEAKHLKYKAGNNAGDTEGKTP